jgi:hypothetical protein
LKASSNVVMSKERRVSKLVPLLVVSVTRDASIINNFCLRLLAARRRNSEKLT